MIIGLIVVTILLITIAIAIIFFDHHLGIDEKTISKEKDTTNSEILYKTIYKYVSSHHSEADISELKHIVIGVQDLDIKINNYLDLQKYLQSKIIGQKELINICIIALISGSHILLRGAPGSGKTSIIKYIGEYLGIDIGRIQGTPDLQPADIVGYHSYNPASHSRDLHLGNIYQHITLIDEINRIHPKTQSALLQAMSEGHTTIDDKQIDINKPYIFMATMNTTDKTSIYDLPIAQLDRFAISIDIGDLSSEDSQSIISQYHNISEKHIDYHTPTQINLSQYISIDLQHIKLGEVESKYIVKLSEILKKSGMVHNLGARLLQDTVRISQSIAYISGDTQVTKHHIHQSLKYIYGHRMK